MGTIKLLCKDNNGMKSFRCYLKMSQEAYLRMLNAQNQSTVQSPDPLQYYNSFEKGMITSPIVKGVASGGLVVVGAAATTAAYVWTITTGWQAFAATPLIQGSVGFAEGFIKAWANTGPCTPSFYSSPAYQWGAQEGRIFYNKVFK